MTVNTAFSIKKAPKEAVDEISSVIKANSQLVIFFASSQYDPAQISTQIQKVAGNAFTIGCTTAGEIGSGKMMKGSVVAMGLEDDIIEDVCIQVISELKGKNDISAAFKGFEKHFGKPMSELDIEKYVGIVIVDGLQTSEENLMEKIGDLTDLTFIGGSAGDDLAFKKTFVFANGKTYTNAAVLAVLKLKKGFDIIKAQSFCSLKKILKATKVDESRRLVMEFNDKPAIVAYAEALGVTTAELPNQFMSHPLGLISADGQPYVRSPQQIIGDSIAFYCNIKLGMQLEILESMDIVKDTTAVVNEKTRLLGTVSGMINFHCILRTLELEKKKQTESYGQIFSSIPTIGFSTYGEEYIGHINQTSTILVFK
jgi:hypothetical protein